MTGGTTSLHEPVGTTIQGNMIGTDATGTYALGNTAAGIGTAAAGSMLVGGAASGARNLISGNQVGLNLGEAVGAVVEGNDIGTNLAGAAVPNALDGIRCRQAEIRSRRTRSPTTAAMVSTSTPC